MSSIKTAPVCFDCFEEKTWTQKALNLAVAALYLAYYTPLIPVQEPLVGAMFSISESEGRANAMRCSETKGKKYLCV